MLWAIRTDWERRILVAQMESSAAPPERSYRDRCTVAIATALRASGREVQESFVAA